MKASSFKLFICCLILFGFLFSWGCDDDDGGTNPIEEGKPKLVITTTVGQSIYLGTIKDLDVGSINNENSYEHVDKAAPFIYKDMVFVIERWNGDILHKYTRTDDAVLAPAGTLTLPAGGEGYYIAFKDDSKAYVALASHGSIYSFNPTTMEHIGSVDLTMYGVGGGNSNPTQMIIRNDGKMFVTLVQRQTAYTSHDSGYVAIINTVNDEVEKVIVDERVTGLGSGLGNIIIDEKNDIYVYSQGDFGYAPNAKDGILRIKNGETQFDPSYYFSPKSQVVDGVTGGIVLYGMVLCYGGDGKTFANMFAPALSSDPPDYENDKTAQPIVIDLYNKTITKINLPNSSMFASSGILKFDDKILFGMSTINGDGIYTYDLNSGAVSENPVITTVGKPQFLSAFED